MTASNLETTVDFLSECEDDPHLFNELFVADGRSFWSRQRELCEAVVQYRTVACYSGNMVGKDFCVARLIWWWLYTRPNSLVIVTAPTQTLLGSVTWKEVRRAEPRIKLFDAKISSGVKTSPQQVDLGNGWQALGFSTTSMERASGQHADELLVIVDEASGVEEEIWDAIESLGYTRLVAIGNPIRADGRFVQLIRQAEMDARDAIPPRLAVKAIQIPSTESPHANLEKSPWGLADQTWLESCYRRYGKDSLWVRSHIKAEIPVVSADTLIPESWLDWAASQSRPECALGHPIHTTRRISCDLGEGVGRDSSCILVRDDLGILDVVFGSALGLPEAAEVIWRKAHQWQIVQERISYDRVGIGRDFPHHLAARGLLRCVGYAGESSPASSDFTNLRAESAWKLRQRLEPGFTPDLTRPYESRTPFVIPPGPFWSRLREELRVLTYELQGRQLKLLPKKDWKTILGHSPDLADALIQSFAF